MGLALAVGMLADLKSNDEEGFAHHAGTFDRLNSFLAAEGLPRYLFRALWGLT